MKKILLIAPYRQNDGWGLAARDYAMALETTEHDVAIRPIYMSKNTNDELDPLLLEMEGRRFDDYDMVIQKVLPHLYEKSRIPSIALFTLETGNIQRTPWYKHMQIMDGIFVPSSHEKNVITRAGGVEGKLARCWNISEPIDTSIFQKEWGWFEGVPKDAFNFYFIGEFSPRKNLDALIMAFHREFHRSEPVNLILKTNRGGMASHDLNNLLQNHINSLKAKMRIYSNPSLYKSELVITQFLSLQELYQLHESCDCFVAPSYGEAFCRPAVDALGFGNTPIVTNNTGMDDYMNNELGWLVDSHEVPVLSENTPVRDLYTSKETWSQIDVLQLQKAMREAYEADRTKKQHAANKFMYNFSYENIGRNMKEAIDEYDSGK